MQQLKLNCPMPINGGYATDLDITNNQVITYQIVYDNSTSDYNLTVFVCGANDLLGVSTVVYTTANNWFDVGLGYLSYISNFITAIGQKFQAFVTMTWLFFNAPAEVTGLSFFTYINIILVGFVGLGVFMVIRGNG